MRRKITNETWGQIKTGYAAGVGLREIARKMNIPEGTVLAYAKRHGWTQQIHVATRDVAVMQSDAITQVHSVPRSLAAILAERKDRTRLGLSKYVAEAAEHAAASRADSSMEPSGVCRGGEKAKNLLEKHALCRQLCSGLKRPQNYRVVSAGLQP